MRTLKICKAASTDFENIQKYIDPEVAQKFEMCQIAVLTKGETLQAYVSTNSKVLVLYLLQKTYTVGF